MEDMWGDFLSIWKILYCIETYNIIWVDIYLSCFCLYFITSLSPDSVLCLLQKPALDLCCVVGLLPPLILIMTSGKFWDFVITRVKSSSSLYFSGRGACSGHAFMLELALLQLSSMSISCCSQRTMRPVIQDVWSPDYEEKCLTIMIRYHVNIWDFI